MKRPGDAHEEEAKKSLRSLGQYILKASTAMIKNHKKFSYQDALTVVHQDDSDSVLVELGSDLKATASW
jgi:hypothetical protein